MNSHMGKRARLGGMVLLGSVCLACGPERSSGQEMRPPPPDTASSVLRMPAPVPDSARAAQATLPEEGQGITFLLQLGGAAVAGDWNVQGNVTDVDSGSVSFRTADGQGALLLYRLVPAVQLPIRAGESIAVRRTMRGHGAVLGYTLDVTAGNRLTLSSARLSDDSALVETVADGVRLSQIAAERSLLTRSQYEVLYQVPLRLSVDGQELVVAVGQATEFRHQDNTYALLVTRSNEVAATPEYEGLQEGGAFSLEYVVILQP